MKTIRINYCKVVKLPAPRGPCGRAHQGRHRPSMRRSSKASAASTRCGSAKRWWRRRTRADSLQSRTFWPRCSARWRTEEGGFLARPGLWRGDGEANGRAERSAVRPDLVVDTLEGLARHHPQRDLVRELLGLQVRDDA